MGKSVVVVSPDKHLGGLSSGGLGFTDTGNKAVIGGLAREFYHRVYQHYQKPDAWQWEKREQFGNKGQGTVALDGENRTMWIFEPSVAEKVFEELVAEINAAFCCASLGITPTVRHADYIGSWLEVLREDNRAIVRAASQASKAADWLLGFLPDADVGLSDDEREAA